MLSVIIAVFLLMLISAGLGFAIAWSWQYERFQQLQAKFEQLQELLSSTQEKQSELEAHANRLQYEKTQFKSEKNKLTDKAKQLQVAVNQLEEDKEFIFKEYDQFRTQVKIKMQSNQKLIDAFEELKEKNQRAKVKVDKWKIKYHENLEHHQLVEEELRKLRKDHKLLQSQVVGGADQSNALIEWESNYKELKLRYLALAREKKDLEANLSNQQKHQVENKTLQEKIIKEQAPTKPSKIGEASSTQKNDLQLIRGIGPFIEQKLNAIGIFRFQQIARLSKEDILELNENIELLPDQIQADDWVGQAQQMSEKLEE